jgi:hypothetical protein
MRICYGWGRTPLKLSREQRYYEEEVMDMLRPYFAVYSTASPLIRVPIWMHVEDEYVRLEGEREITLACRLASIYHNSAVSRAPIDDGWDEETALMEAEAEERMQAEEEEEEDMEMHGDYVRV